MKTQKAIFSKMNILGMLLFSMLVFNTTYAQTESNSINGIISDTYGPVEDANIVLKGTKTGTTTNENGEFIFPKNLNKGDVLIVSYLGYKTQTITVKDNSQKLNLLLIEDVVEIAGALNSNKPYKSSRK